MFKIADGRKSFYQWDLNRKLIVEDESITQVHFCNRTEDCSLVVEVKDGIAEVPNILLQESWRIKVFAYDGEMTKHSEVFLVTPRSKPADYVYTETEILNYNTLLDKMNQIDENIAQTITDYLEENPVEVDLSNYATKDEIPSLEGYAKTEDIPDVSGYAKAEDIPSLEGYAKTEDIPSLEGYAKTEDIPSLEGYAKTADIPSVEGLASEKYVDDAIAQAKLEGDDIDLSEYAKKTDIPDTSGFLTAIPEEYITETELADKGYLTEHQDLTGYAKTADIPSLEGYAKTADIPDVSAYQTEEQVNALITAALGEVENGTY